MEKLKHIISCFYEIILQNFWNIRKINFRDMKKGNKKNNETLKNINNKEIQKFFKDWMYAAQENI